MGEQRHSRETIIQTLQNIAAQVGRPVLSKKDVQAHLSLSVVNYHFGRLSDALAAAGLVANKPGSPDGIPNKRLSDDELFESIVEVENQIGRAPSFSDYRADGGRFSNRPFNKRFGGWSSVIQHYRKWQIERCIAHAPAANFSCLSTLEGQRAELSPSQLQIGGAVVPSERSRKPSQLFGEPIDFRGLRHAPTNEQGVVYLFGMVSRELGFSIEALQQGFPDCEGKYLYDQSRKLWAKARIEFEFRATNFREHGHDANECDVIICWQNDWPDCPLRVVELKSEIMRLPSR